MNVLSDISTIHATSESGSDKCFVSCMPHTIFILAQIVETENNCFYAWK